MKLEKIGRKLGEKEIKYPLRFLLIIIALSIILAPGILQINIQPSLEKVLPEDTKSLEKMNEVRNEIGADMVYLIYDTNDKYTDIRKPEILKQAATTEEKILQEKNVISITSFAEMIKDYNNGVIPQDYSKIKSIYKKAKAQNDPRTDLLNNEYNRYLVEIRTNTGADSKPIKDTIEAIRYDVEKSNQLGLKTGITGYNALNKATFQVIMSDFSYTTFLAFLFIAIVVYIFFRSITKGLIPMAIVMLALLWTNGTVGYLGIPLTVVSMGAAAMVMGIGIDFGIHMINLYKELRNKKYERKEALVMTLEKEIRAITGASMTTIAGFLSLWFSSLPAIADLGTVLLLGIFYSMIGTLLGMIPLLNLYEKRMERKNTN